MLTKPSRPALRAFYSLSNHAVWEDISKFFDGELTSTYEQLTQAQDEVTVRRLQGRAQFMIELLKMVREAPALLEKLRDTTL